jgi:uncharacterized protein YndB with AHSA1/START domain
VKQNTIAAVLSAATIFWSSVAADEDTFRVTSEHEINASVAEVWKAFTTDAGLKLWMAPVVKIDLKIGGKMSSSYIEDATLGDDSTIENTIMAYDPNRMLALQATRFPKGFSFEDAAKGTWSVFYFSKLSPTRTKVVIVGLGYRDDEQSQKMRSFFATANEYSMDKLNKALQARAKDAVQATDSKTEE